MDAKVEPPQKKKITISPSPPSFSSLPDELILHCLARISKSYYRSLSLVSKSFYSLLTSLDIYAFRSQIGTTEPCLYICLKSPTCRHSWITLDETLITNGGEIKDELSLEMVKLPSSHSPTRLNSTTVVAGSEIYQIGGINKTKRSRAVSVLDCCSHKWRRAPNMRLPRVDAKSWFLDGKIYVMGGCRKREESMNWGEVLDLKTQTWKPLPCPSDNGVDFNHKENVAVLRGRLYVTTKDKNYVYDPKEGRWKETLEMGSDICFGLSLESITGPWCLVENVMINDNGGRYWWWYESSSGMIPGLSDLYMKRASNYRTIQLVNYGGKLLIIWQATINKRTTWYALIRLEKRLSSFERPQIWGEVERFNVFVPTIPKSYELVNCLSGLR